MNAGQAMLQWLVGFCTKKLLVARVLRHCFTRWNMVHGGCSSVRCEQIGFYDHHFLPQWATYWNKRLLEPLLRFGRLPQNSLWCGLRLKEESPIFSLRMSPCRTIWECKKSRTLCPDVGLDMPSNKFALHLRRQASSRKCLRNWKVF